MPRQSVRTFTLLIFALLLFVLLLLSACAALQDGASAALADPETSARQEFLADVMLDAGRNRLALEGYDKALLARPGDALLRVKKGRVMLRLSQPEAALVEFRTALAANPELAAAQYGAGQAALRLGRDAPAREAFARAVALAPTSWHSRCALGVLLLKEGQAVQAQEQFLAALALPQFRSQAQGQAVTGREELLNNLGLSQVLAGDTEAAVRTFSLAIRDARDPERSANNLGLLLVRLGRQAEAFMAFRAGGNDARALNNLGYALYLQGHALKARELFEKALDLAPAYYETAGENLKLAVQGASAPRDEDKGANFGGIGKGAGSTEAVGRGASLGVVVQNASEGATAPIVARLTLFGQSGAAPTLGSATLLGEGGEQR